MSKQKFKVGDKVRLKKGLVVGNVYGKMTFLSLMKFTGNAEVKAINSYGIYALNGFWYSSEMLEPAKPEKIIIYRDGQKMIAKNTATGKTGVARCNPTDTFNFITGAILALTRLTGIEPKIVSAEPEKPKYFTGKIVCVESPNVWFTKGKIYNVNNGIFKDDEGDEHKHFKSVDDLNRQYMSQFIELME